MNYRLWLGRRWKACRWRRRRGSWKPEQRVPWLDAGKKSSKRRCDQIWSEYEPEPKYDMSIERALPHIQSQWNPIVTAMEIKVNQIKHSEYSVPVEYDFTHVKLRVCNSIRGYVRPWVRGSVQKWSEKTRRRTMYGLVYKLVYSKPDIRARYFRSQWDCIVPRSSWSFSVIVFCCANLPVNRSAFINRLVISLAVI